jgi:hypothetical protein
MSSERLDGTVPVPPTPTAFLAEPNSLAQAERPAQLIAQEEALTAQRLEVEVQTQPETTQAPAPPAT